MTVPSLTQTPAEGLTVKQDKPAMDHNRVPSNWTLTMDGDELVGHNDANGNDFRGTHEQFNKILRGE